MQVVLPETCVHVPRSRPSVRPQRQAARPDSRRDRRCLLSVPNRFRRPFMRMAAAVIDHLIDFAVCMSVLIVVVGVLMFIAGGIAALLATTRPCHPMRDW